MCREECSIKGKRALFKAIQNNAILLKYPESILLSTTINSKNNLVNHQNISHIFIANLFGGII